MKQKATYALFGGSFDPPHLGHSEIIKSVLELKLVTNILVVPTYLNPFKSSFTVEPKKRLEWVKRVFNFKGAEVISYEIEQGKATYSVQTYKELSKKYNITSIIIGADNLKDLTKWYEFEYLNQRVCWIVATRGVEEQNYKHLRDYKVLPISVDVSSTDIRDGKSIEFVDEKIRKEVIIEYNTKTN